MQLFFNDKEWDNCIVHLSRSIGIVLGVFCALLRVLKIRSQHVITNLKDDIFCHILLCHALLLLYNSLQFAFCQSQIRQKTLCSRRSSSKFKKNTCANKQTLSNRYLHITLFENYSKCRIWIFEFWYFSPIFVLLKLTWLVTLFDRKLHLSKNSPNWAFLAFSINFCPLKM